VVRIGGFIFPFPVSQAGKMITRLTFFSGIGKLNIMGKAGTREEQIIKFTA